MSEIKKSTEGSELKEDLSNYNADTYKKPSVTVDLLICTILNDELNLLLIKRKYPPFKDHWALPGGFVDIDREETLEQTANRELEEETGLKGIFVSQLKSYGDPRRDPRLRVITVAYYALVPYGKIPYGKIRAQDDAKEVAWFSLERLVHPHFSEEKKPLAFDHKIIITDLLKHLRDKMSVSPIAFELVPEKFTWPNLQKVYEIVLGKKLVAPNFRQLIKARYKIVEESSQKKGKTGRPARFLTYCGTKKVF